MRPRQHGFPGAHGIDFPLDDPFEPAPFLLLQRLEQIVLDERRVILLPGDLLEQPAATVLHRIDLQLECSDTVAGATDTLLGALRSFRIVPEEPRPFARA